MKGNKLFVLLLLTTTTTFAQWTRVIDVPAIHIRSLISHHDTLYATTDSNIIYRGTNGGMIWNSIIVGSSSVKIFCLAVYHDTLFAGTFQNGIFYSGNAGQTWQNSLTVNTFVADFAIKDDILYAATDDGVMVLNATTRNWAYMNDSLPSYSIGVDKIIGSPNFLLIAAGANGTFYRYNFSAPQWNEEYYYGSLKPGLKIEGFINEGDTLFATTGNKILLSLDAGHSWSNDLLGSHEGYSRKIYGGPKYYYTLTNDLFGGTWLQQRSKQAPKGSTWDVNEEYLPGGYSFTMIAFNNRLFIGRENGLYTKSLISGLAQQKVNEVFTIYPNPCRYGAVLSISGEEKIYSLQLFNSMGQVVYETEVNAPHVDINHSLSAGLYYVKLTYSQGAATSKVVITN
jgi:hypothetical protein